MDSGDHPSGEAMSEPALVLDDVTPMDLRKLADRLLEATRVEYVDDGVLLIMNPPASEQRDRAVDSESDRSTPAEERAAIALIVEVTSPASADTVYNDRVVKPRQYARAGISLYLLVDQERTAWTLHGLSDKPGYELLAAGKYGESVPLPAPFGFSIPSAEWPTSRG